MMPWLKLDGDGEHGTWMGIDRSGWAYPGIRDQGPTLEERQERCEQMGLVFCACKLDNGHVVVYNPTCPVHQHFCKL